MPAGVCRRGCAGRSAVPAGVCGEVAAGRGQGGRRCRSLFHKGCGSGCVPGLRCRRWGACLPRAAVSPRRRPSSCIRPRCRGVRHGGRSRCRRPTSPTSPFPGSPLRAIAPQQPRRGAVSALSCDRSVAGSANPPAIPPARAIAAASLVSWRPRSPLPPRRLALSLPRLRGCGRAPRLFRPRRPGSAAAGLAAVPPPPRPRL